MKADRFSTKQQYLLSLATVGGLVLIGLAVHEFVGHRVIAFLFLLGVSGIALVVDIRPVIIAALLSALAWNYLFIPPRFTFTIGATEDRILVGTYFLVVLVHAVLTYRIRIMQQEIRKKEVKEDAARFYNTLLNSLSHELQTPITTIIGATDNLQSNGGRISEADKNELLSEISIASQRLNQQVENLLNMSRIESGVFAIRKDWVDIKEMIYGTLQKFEPTIKQWPTHVFVQDAIPLFKLDFGLMDQILGNLVSNVMQHTPEGTEITIKANCRNDRLILSIGDTGQGFPDSEIDRVFDKFYRVNGSKAGGTGLGLSIVRGFVESQGGTIRLRNLPLRGAEFTIEIPTEVSHLSGLKSE
jgi:two-component system, OmpR family, sensor histidine kinase KdpD